MLRHMRHTLPWCVLLLCGILWHAVPAFADTGPGDWWMFHHDARHTGCSAYAVPNPAQTLWKFSTGGAIKSSPVIGAQGTIYVGSEDMNLYAINPDGRKQWAFSTGGFVESAPAIGADGTIYTCSYIPPSPLPVTPYFYAVNPNGTLKWSYPLNSSISPTIGTDGTIYIAADDGNLYALTDNGTSASLKWSTKISPTSSPAIGTDGNIYVGGGNHLYQITPDGTVQGTFGTLGPIYSSPTIGQDGTIYFGCDDDNFYAVTTGWNFAAVDVNYPIETSPVIGPDGTIFVGIGNGASAEGWLGAFSNVNGNLTVQWYNYIDKSVESSPAVDANGMVYFGGTDNTIYAYPTVYSTTPAWTISTQGPIHSSPAIGNNGTLYIGSDDGNLYAIGQAPTLNIAKSVSRASAAVGDVVTYTLSYQNTGPGGASNVTITDPLPAGLSYVANSAFGAAASYDPGTNTLTLSVGLLAPGSEDNVTFQALVGSSVTAGSTINNAAYIYCSESRFGDWSNTVSLSVFLSQRGNWWMFQHDPQHTGRTMAIGPATPELQWSNATQGMMKASPAFSANGTIYIGSDDDNLYAFNSNGSLKWKYATGGAIRTTPAIGEDGTIYFGSEDSYFYALTDNSSTCSLKWNVQVSGAIHSSPVIAPDGTIYFGSDDGHLYGLYDNGSSALPALVYPTGGPVKSSPALAADGTIYVGAGNSLFAINPSGWLNWSALTNGTVNASPAVGADGSIYFGSADGNLIALTDNGNSCSRKWFFSTGSSIDNTPAIGADGTIYIGSGTNLFALTDQGSSVKTKWEFTGFTDQLTSVVIDGNGVLYLGCNEDYLVYALIDAGSSCTPEWLYATGGRFESAPAIDANGNIYIGSDDDKLYVIGAPPDLFLAERRVDG